MLAVLLTRQHLAPSSSLLLLLLLLLSCRDKLARVLLHGSKLLDAFDAVLSCISHLCQQVR